MSTPEEHPKPFTPEELRSLARSKMWSDDQRKRFRATADQLERYEAPVTDEEATLIYDYTAKHVMPGPYTSMRWALRRFLERRRTP